MTDTEPHVTMADYESTDGYTDTQDQQCPHCETPFAADTAQTVIDRDGVSYTSIAATMAADGPFFCPACWADLETNRLANEYNSTCRE